MATSTGAPLGSRGEDGRMIIPNKVSPKMRLKELFFDWLAITVYLLCLLGVNILLYLYVFGSVPEFSEQGSQLVATLSSVVPVVLAFSVLDYRGGSLGKRKVGLTLHFEHRTFLSALLRNVTKFIPWQIAHFGMIRGMYHDFDAVSILATCISVVLLLTMLIMGLFRKDRRHQGDLIAGTQVQVAD